MKNKNLKFRQLFLRIYLDCYQLWRDLQQYINPVFIEKCQGNLKNK